MRSQTQRFATKVLPKGWPDLGWQIVLFCGAYWLYRIVRGISEGNSTAAFDNARQIVGVEHSLGLFIEPAVHTWASANGIIIEIASLIYVHCHFTITVLTLAFIYLFRNRTFCFVRNMFMVAMGVALILYVYVPTAPPRFLTELGFADPLSEEATSTNILFNPYAAIPSMHVAFALMLGLSMRNLVRSEWAKILWCIYPLVVTFSVIATANHWWIDALLGAATAGFGALTAFLAARVGPDSWRWSSYQPMQSPKVS